MRTLIALTILLIVAAAAGPATRARPEEPADGPLSPAWEIPLPDTSAPFLAGTADGFLVGTPSGRLRAHRADGSGPLWEVDLEARILTAPVLAPDRLAITLEGGTVAILRSGDGGPVARAEAPSAAPSEAAAHLVSLPAGFVISRGPTVTLLDPSTGTALWSTELPAPASAAAAQCGTHLLVGTQRGDLVSIDPADGAVRWSRPLAEGAITTAAGCWHDRAFVGAADNRLYAVKLQRRKPDRKWSFLTGGDMAGRPLVHGGRLLVLSYDTYLYALEADNGHLAWRVRLGRRPRPDGVLYGDRLVVAPLNTEILEIFALPGGVQGPPPSLLQDKERFVSPPVLAGGNLIVIAAARYGEDTARLIAVDPGGIGSLLRP